VGTQIAPLALVRHNLWSAHSDRNKSALSEPPFNLRLSPPAVVGQTNDVLRALKTTPCTVLRVAERLAAEGFFLSALDWQTKLSVGCETCQSAARRPRQFRHFAPRKWSLEKAAAFPVRTAACVIDRREGHRWTGLGPTDGLADNTGKRLTFLIGLTDVRCRLCVAAAIAYTSGTPNLQSARSHTHGTCTCDGMIGAHGS